MNSGATIGEGGWMSASLFVVLLLVVVIIVTLAKTAMVGSPTERLRGRAPGAL
jgi:hypothetical protein